MVDWSVVPTLVFGGWLGYLLGVTMTNKKWKRGAKTKEPVYVDGEHYKVRWQSYIQTARERAHQRHLERQRQKR